MTAEARTRQRYRAPRKFDHQAAADARAAGHSWRTIANFFGVDHKTIRNAVGMIPASRCDAARSPIPCPTPADPPPPGRVDGGDASTGGLRGAPAITPFTPARDEKGKDPHPTAGAPIVRRQLDEHGDTVYVFDLPAARYQTHSYSLVLEMLQPFDPGTVRWINEED